MMFLQGHNIYENVDQNKFKKVPGRPIGYEMSDSLLKAFDNELLSSYAISNGQNITGNNEKYLRLIWEVDKINTVSYDIKSIFMSIKENLNEEKK